MNKNLMLSSSVWHREDRERAQWPGGGTLLGAASRLLIASLLLVSCTQASTESRSSTVITVDRLEPGQIISNRANATALIAHPLADAQSRVSDSAMALIASDAGRELFSFIVTCALPPDAILVATLNNTELEFFGALGLAPQWRSSPLNLTGQRWVSACVFARVTAYSLAIPISARGPNLGLAATDESTDFTLEEGAFYGNMFVPLDQPIQSFACRGRDDAAGEDGDLAHRGCAEPDPTKPGLTLCGFAFAGDCGSFSADQTCESFSSNGTFYRRCHTAPIHTGQGTVFEQVITTFVLP